MNKKVILSCLLFSILFFLSQTTIAQQYVHTEGTKIVDGNGEELIFRGFGLGGWMLQEGYMLGTWGPQHELESRIEDLVGAANKEAFYEAWLENHTRKIDVDSLAAWGFNLIRLPMHYKLFTPPIEEEPVPGEITWLDTGFEMTDELLSWCEENNMYLILDLHAAPGGQGENADISDYDPTKPSLWESEDNQEKMIALWRRLAERYAEEPFIAGYDLINEPNWGFQNHNTDPHGCAESQNLPLWELQKAVTAAIREVDPNHMIIIEGNCWGGNYSGLPVLWDDNLVISYHKYWNANDQGAIQVMLDMRENRQAPIWLGETGENSNTWFTNAIALLENNDIGWAWWPLKKLGINNPLEVPRNPGYQNILDYWHGNGPIPNANTAANSLMQLAEDLKLEHNIYHPDVVDAMIRQPHSDEAIPYKRHLIASGTSTVIFATDFDMGKHEVAYRDSEVENASGGSGGSWNLGGAYRNDGVDIESCQDIITNGYSVGWTANGEWMQYTVEVEETGYYEVDLRCSSTSNNSVVRLDVNAFPATRSISLPNTSAHQNWKTVSLGSVSLNSGTNILRLHIEKGGANLNHLSFNGPSAQAEQQPVLLKANGINGEHAISLVFNQFFQPFSAESAFRVSYNGEPVEVVKADLNTANARAISLEVAAPLSYGDEVLLDYLGTMLTTQSGTLVDAFTGVEVEITLADGIIPLSIPGLIEAESFAKNSGFVFEECTDFGGGMNAGFTDFGDYLDYWVYVEQTGPYQLGFRVASQSAGGNMDLLQLSDQGNSTLTNVFFGPTGGWQTWNTVNKEVELEKGLQSLRLRSKGELFNINWMDFVYIGEDTTIVDPPGEVDLLTISPNPNINELQLAFGQVLNTPTEAIIYNAQGQKVMEVSIVSRVDEVTIPHQLPTGQYVLTCEVNRKRVSRKFVVQ